MSETRSLMAKMDAIARAVKADNYKQFKRALMRGSCWIAPMIPLGDGRVAIQLYHPLVRAWQ